MLNTRQTAFRGNRSSADHADDRGWFKLVRVSHAAIISGQMRSFTAILVALSSWASTFAFEFVTPEMKKADAAWEQTIRRQFDFERLHEFLLRTLAGQKRFEEIDLASSHPGKTWVVNRHRRTLVSGNWWFRRDEKGAGFQFRYYPGKGEREVVLLCEREGRGKFRFVEIRWDRVTMYLARDEKRAEPATTMQRGQPSVFGRFTGIRNSARTRPAWLIGNVSAKKSSRDAS